MKFNKILIGVLCTAMLSNTAIYFPNEVFAEDDISTTFTFDNFSVTYDVTNSCRKHYGS